MRKIRSKLTYSNVVSTLCLFLILGSGAYAAQKIGSKQLKTNAVTTKKIKNGAVTTKKLKDGAVNSAKVADGSITGADVNVPSLPVTRTTQKMRGNSTQPVTNTPTVYPLNNSTYTQAGDETDIFTGAVDVTFESTCTGDRMAQADVLVDGNPTSPVIQDIGALGVAGDSTGGTVSTRINLGPFYGSRFEPGSPKNHTVSLIVFGSCGGGSGITATFGGVDVIANR